MTLSARQPKPKNCAVQTCRAPFVPTKAFQTWCSTDCAIVIANEKIAKKNAIERKSIQQRERREIKARKKKLKSHSDYVRLAEKAVRDYRRTYELSIGSGCISCGKTQAEIQAAQGWKTGGAFDGGHFLSKGARPELRLEPSNIWLQCKSCNAGSSKYARKGKSVTEGFREGLIERIGLEAVQALEADHAPRKYTNEELESIAVHYRALWRQLQKEAANA